MNIEQLRAEFEAWVSTQGVVTKYGAKLHRSSCGNHYKDLRVNQRWLAFKAGRAALESPEVQALRKDAERLDWLDARAHCADWVEGEPTKRVIRAEDGQVYTGDTWREAIDAAMEKQK